MAQQSLFAQLKARFGGERMLILDSETLMAEPRAAVAMLASLYGLPLDGEAVAAIVAGPAFKRHSKFGNEFGSEQRGMEQRDATVIHGDEIDKVAHWAEVVAANAGISLNLGTPLTA